MKGSDVPTLFVIDDDAARAWAVQGRATQRWTQLSGRFCSRLLIEGARVWTDHAKGALTML
jgi:hypothetical protein